MERRDRALSQQSARRAVRRSALDAQAVLRKERADRKRRLEGLAVAVMTALGANVNNRVAIQPCSVDPGPSGVSPARC